MRDFLVSLRLHCLQVWLKLNEETCNYLLKEAYADLKDEGRRDIALQNEPRVDCVVEAAGRINEHLQQLKPHGSFIKAKYVFQEQCLAEEREN